MQLLCVLCTLLLYLYVLSCSGGKKRVPSPKIGCSIEGGINCSTLLILCYLYSTQCVLRHSTHEAIIHCTVFRDKLFQCVMIENKRPRRLSSFSGNNSLLGLFLPGETGGSEFPNRLSVSCVILMQRPVKLSNCEPEIKDFPHFS